MRKSKQEWKDLKVKSDLRAGAITVYGTDWCGYTTKQRDYLDGKGVDYTYVNCEEKSCPDFVKAYPTLDINGSIKTGYTEV